MKEVWSVIICLDTTNTTPQPEGTRGERGRERVKLVILTQNYVWLLLASLDLFLAFSGSTLDATTLKEHGGQRPIQLVVGRWNQAKRRASCWHFGINFDYGQNAKPNLRITGSAPFTPKGCG